jgi:hypothetical protein
MLFKTQYLTTLKAVMSLKNKDTLSDIDKFALPAWHLSPVKQFRNVTFGSLV